MCILLEDDIDGIIRSWAGLNTLLAKQMYFRSVLRDQLGLSTAVIPKKIVDEVLREEVFRMLDDEVEAMRGISSHIISKMMNSTDTLPIFFPIPSEYISINIRE